MTPPALSWVLTGIEITSSLALQTRSRLRLGLPNRRIHLLRELVQSLSLGRAIKYSSNAGVCGPPTQGCESSQALAAFQAAGMGCLLFPGHRPAASALGWGLPARWAGGPASPKWRASRRRPNLPRGERHLPQG